MRFGCLCCLTTSVLSSEICSIKSQAHFRKVFSSAPARTHRATSVLYSFISIKAHNKCIGRAYLSISFLGSSISQSIAQTSGHVPNRPLKRVLFVRAESVVRRRRPVGLTLRLTIGSAASMNVDGSMIILVIAPNLLPVDRQHLGHAHCAGDE
jgi:hypothetical protein